MQNGHFPTHSAITTHAAGGRTNVDGQPTTANNRQLRRQLQQARRRMELVLLNVANNQLSSGPCLSDCGSLFFSLFLCP